MTNPYDEESDRYTNWVEKVIKNFSQEFYHKHETKIFTYGNEIDTLFQEYFEKGYKPLTAAEMIEKTIEQ